MLRASIMSDKNIGVNEFVAVYLVLTKRDVFKC
jgi:hypothetical protein